MEIYTLDDQFRKVDVIDEYVSAIWTERYIDSGDVTLVVAATEANRALLVEGTRLATPDSEQVMVVDTQDIQSGVLKVTGGTLDKAFQAMLIVFSYSIDQQQQAYTDNAGAIMNYLAYTFASATGWAALHSSTLPLDIDGAKQVLPNFVLGAEAAGASQTFSVTRGPLYDEIKKIAQQANVGWKLIPINVTAVDYDLEFSTYAGRDLTSAQSILPVVRFSPALDSLADIKELRSKANYRTVAYAITPDFDPLTLTIGPPYPYTGKAYAYPTAEFETGFARRTILVEITGVTAESVGDSIFTYEELMDAHARDALANNNFTKVVDGEVVPQSEFKYGVDYLLGDIIELQDKTGYIQNARITEYIRSQDKNGSREYPTVSVIE